MIDAIALRDLANKPGYGFAQTMIKKMGYWDEYAGDRDPREFQVTMTGQIVCQVYGYVTVEARSEAEARELALSRADKGLVNWDEPDEPDDYEITEVRARGADGTDS